jgi:protein-tyrosine phosphatase
VCLAPDDELRRKSPAYASVLTEHTAPVEVHHFPIADFSVPDDERALVASVMVTAEHLRGGGKVLIHCGAGIGRTGLYATGVLLALGLPVNVAKDFVRKAGSGAEVAAQDDALRRLEQALRRQPNTAVERA